MKAELRPHRLAELVDLQGVGGVGELGDELRRVTARERPAGVFGTRVLRHGLGHGREIFSADDAGAGCLGLGEGRDEDVADAGRTRVLGLVLREVLSGSRELLLLRGQQRGELLRRTFGPGLETLRELAEERLAAVVRNQGLAGGSVQRGEGHLAGDRLGVDDFVHETRVQHEGHELGVERLLRRLGLPVEPPFHRGPVRDCLLPRQLVVGEALELLVEGRAAHLHAVDVEYCVRGRRTGGQPGGHAQHNDREGEEGEESVLHGS